ncbi:thymidylate kinase [Thermocrinis ruber]|uniref:Thymidylate kinase n=1 Tax=Thermocrinis ruber TaxID=75906 RepID=W0DDZ2_9AQUI|nr:dTMP kinase [Thermocrinis ruber]AHE95462.1 thymidylate kinase [Thermocrinis ruber]
MKGFLISFEGIDGSGKSTQARKLYEFLKEEGYEVSLYRDPGSTPLAEQIRELIINYAMDPITELLLFESARSSLVWEKIFPDLTSGKIVIVDRFIDSTTAYQGYGREINLGTVSILNHIATRGRKPDLTFILNLPLELALHRLKEQKTKFEEPNYLKRVRDGYLQIFYSEKERDIRLIDASRSEEEVFEEIKTITLGKLKVL